MAEALSRSTGQTRPGMLVIGAVFAALGAVILFMLLIPVQPVPDVRETVAGLAGDTAGRSPVWAVAGGLSLAIGLGLVGIGMNRWTSSR